MLTSRRNLLLAALISLPLPALAQQQPTPPEYYTLDERGVDLVSGQFTHQAVDVVIGPADGGLAHGRVWTNGGWRDILSGTIAVTGSTYVVSFGGVSEVFTLSGSTFTPVSNNGSTLSQSGSNLTFTTSDGTVATYSTAYSGSTTAYAANNAALIQVRRPNGDQTDFAWDGVTYCSQFRLEPDGPGECLQFQNAVRVESVRNNRGYQINYRYGLNTPPADTFEVQTGWLKRTGAIGVNLAVDYCNPFDNDCTGTRVWPSVTYQSGDFGGDITAVTDQSGRTTSYSYINGLSGVRLPGQSSDQLSVTYANGRVASVTGATGTWNYVFNDAGSIRTTTATGPENQQTTVTSDLSTGRATSVVEAVGPGTSRTIGYQYDSQRRLNRVTQPEGNYTQIAYDTRGNVTQTTQVAKSGSGLANIVSGATYPATCTNVRTCNQPTSTTDPRGNVTDYTYDATHGGLLTVTEPAPTAGANRPQTRVSYASQTAWYKNASGTIVASPVPITLPIAVGACVSGTVAGGCAGTANEIVSVVTYGTSGVANTLLPTTTTTRSGNGSLSATTTLTYTPNGDIETVDGPLTTQSDIVRYVHDDARQMTGMIGPDPDGAGPLRHRAMRTIYNPDGTVSLSEVGTTVGQGPTAMAGFTLLQQTSLVHDIYLRPTQSAFTAGGTLYALNQVFYDASGRPFCQVQRMNPATFLSPPSCAPTTGPFGPDRIAVTTYDRASQPLTVTTGDGTPDALIESVSWTRNGLPATLADGQGNITAMTYDGFDRLSRTDYPNPANGQPNPADHQAVTYDPASNVLTSRTRSNQTFTAAYDALNRPTGITAPAPIAGQAPADSVAWTYDNIGRPLSATIPGGVSTAMTWDALGRQVTETGPLGTMGMSYDPAGRRTRLTWPDAFFVNYGYDPTGAMTAITQGAGQTPIAAYGYDDLGRRTAVTRGNGVSTAYGYDPASRLTSLVHNPAGTVADQTYGYTHNPSGQVVTLSGTNDAYAYNGLTAGTTQYGIDGLNRIATVNGTGLGYDANGNLTSDGVRGFGYDAANRLRTAGSVSLTYDALGRLNRQQASSDQRYVYDGPAIVGFATGGTTLGQRFIPGPWVDEIVGNVAANGNLNLWLQDHLGSTVAITNNTGTASAINRYDDYGQPQSGNAGALQYTGQLWMPDAGVYHYKARAYHPGLGRFLQTDPIGYAAGMNLYGYVGGDPVNWTDPLGLQQCVLTTAVDENGTRISNCGTILRRFRRAITSGGGGTLRIGGRGPGTGTGGIGSGNLRQIADNVVCQALQIATGDLAPGNYRLSVNANAVPGVGLTYNIGISFSIGNDRSIRGVFSERGTESFGFDVTAGIQLERFYGNGARAYSAPSRDNGRIRFRPSLRLGPGAGLDVGRSGDLAGTNLAFGLGLGLFRGDVKQVENVISVFEACSDD